MHLTAFRFLLTALLIALCFSGSPAGWSAASAEDIPPAEPVTTPGILAGMGTHFELTDSPYLNIILESTEPVYLSLSSIPNVIEIQVEAAEGALFTQLSLSGLVPGMEYHKYEDSLANHVPFTADANGLYAWTQDLVDPHLIFIQLEPSTLFLRDNTTGGDCTKIGIWDGVTKTCTLTTDVADTIQIEANGITLDGARHTLSGLNNKIAGVYVPAQTGSKYYSNITIKNVIVNGFHDGIYLAKTQGCVISDSTIINPSRYGINIQSSSKGQANLSKNNAALRSTILGVTNSGVYLKWTQANSIRGNLIQGQEGFEGQSGGVEILDAAGNQITGNRIANANIGIRNDGANTFVRNTIAAEFGVDKAAGTFYNNNLLAYTAPYHSGSAPNTLYYPGPYFGNYWEGFNSLEDGCADANLDGLCDAAYTALDKNGGAVAQDLTPWANQDGWLKLKISAPADPVLIGVPVTAGAQFADPDPETTHTVTWDWGDGTVLEVEDSEVNGAASFSLSHMYAETGVYRIGVTVQDSKYLSTAESYYEYIVIYDPSEGFVTGGGWIDSPAGAYVPDPSLTGHASFGFISKYYKGKTVPEGETKFEFHTNVLRFVSTSYEWLVIGGPTQAIYKGVGTVNDQPGYGFMLTAVDGDSIGQVDTFRIRIWRLDSGEKEGLLYDNKIGCPATEYVGTEIGDGSIIIQVPRTRR